MVPCRLTKDQFISVMKIRIAVPVQRRYLPVQRKDHKKYPKSYLVNGWRQPLLPFRIRYESFKNVYHKQKGPYKRATLMRNYYTSDIYSQSNRKSNWKGNIKNRIE